jgi:putative addiction module component (TIGR02574 family)
MDEPARDQDPEDPEVVRAAWKAELLRRVEEIMSGRVVGIPAGEVFRRMREKYGPPE